jgi:hypothetical protein
MIRLSDSKPIRRLVTSVRFYEPQFAPQGTGRNVLTLECGHEITRKASIPVPKRAVCDECKQDLELYDEVRNNS